MSTLLHVKTSAMYRLCCHLGLQRKVEKGKKKQAASVEQKWVTIERLAVSKQPVDGMPMGRASDRTLDWTIMLAFKQQQCESELNVKPVSKLAPRHHFKWLFILPLWHQVTKWPALLAWPVAVKTTRTKGSCMLNSFQSNNCTRAVISSFKVLSTNLDQINDYNAASQESWQLIVCAALAQKIATIPFLVKMINLIESDNATMHVLSFQSFNQYSIVLSPWEKGSAICFEWELALKISSQLPPRCFKSANALPVLMPTSTFFWGNTLDNAVIEQCLGSPIKNIWGVAAIWFLKSCLHSCISHFVDLGKCNDESRKLQKPLMSVHPVNL